MFENIKFYGCVRVIVALTLVLGLGFFCRVVLAEENEEELKEKVQRLEERLDELEAKNLEEELTDPGIDWKAQIKDKVNISGYIDLEYNDFGTEDSTLRPLIDEHGTFNNSHVNLFVDSTINDRFSAFTEIRFMYFPHEDFVEENLRDGHGGLVVIERAWLDITFRNDFNVKVGKFFTPYGVWNMIHRSPLLLSTRTPLLFRKQIFPGATTGAQIYGTFFMSDWELEYNLWAGNGKGHTEETQDQNNNKALGARLNLSVPVDSVWDQFKTLKLGVSGYTGRVEEAEFELHAPRVADINGTPMDMSDDLILEENDLDTISKLDALYGGTGLMFMNGQWMSPKLMSLFMSKGYTPRGEPLGRYQDNVIGFDLQIKIYRLLFQGEYALNFVDPEDDDVDSFRESSYYLQLGYRIDVEKVGVITPFARYDESDPNDELEGELGELNIRTFGINYKPISKVALKAEYHFHVFPEDSERDFEMFASSITVAF